MSEMTLHDKVSEGEPLTDAEKIEYLYQVARRTDALIKKLGPQLEALVSGPMGGMLGMLGGFGK